MLVGSNIKIYHSFWDLGYSELTDNLYNMHKLSALLALKNYGNITLITTKRGLEFLKGIPYTNIELFEDEIDPKLKNTWSISKIYAYKQISKKEEPFLHIDYDVFLFKKLPEWFNSSKIVTQNIENFKRVRTAYDLNKFFNNCPNTGIINPNIRYACNMGIFGGSDFEFFNLYTEKVLELVLDEENRINYWENKNLKTTARAVILEQYMLVNCLEFFNKKMTTLFNTTEPKENVAKKLGYTHLMGSKKEKKILNKVNGTLKLYDLSLQ